VREKVGEMLCLLVVDGEDSIRFSLKEYFTLQGYNVDTARELDAAEKLLEAADYDVVIQDLRLGPALRPDGFELINFIHDQNPRTRIIVLTAYGSAEMEDEALRSGAHAFLRKPKPLSHVAQVIEGLLESRAHQASRGA